MLLVFFISQHPYSLGCCFYFKKIVYICNVIINNPFPPSRVKPWGWFFYFKKICYICKICY